VFLPNLNPISLEDWRADMRVLGWTEGRDFILSQGQNWVAGNLWMLPSNVWWRVSLTSSVLDQPPMRSQRNAQREQFLS